MPLVEFLSRRLSPRVFGNLKWIYYKTFYLWHPRLTEKKFRQIVAHDLGVKNGSVVFIHSAVDKLNLAFPFHQILPILLEIVGDEGTLVFPCWQFDYRAEDYLKKNEIFDVRKTPTVMGILPEFARRYKNAQRSMYPTDSVVAIGKYAYEITYDHINSKLPSDEHSPFHKIMNYNGIIIGLGVSTYNLSFVHCVEDVMKNKFPVKTLTDEIFEARVRDPNGEIHIVKARAPHSQIKYREIEKYMKKNIPPDICRDMKINGVKYFTANSCELFKKMELLAYKGITIYTEEASVRNS
jgi:aminoglycoside N3'-acetyltransferase